MKHTTMKKYLCTMLALALAGLYYGCNKEIEGFDKNMSAIYFDHSSYISGGLTRYNTTMYHSFVFDGINATSYMFEVPVNIIGLAHDRDRSYKVECYEDTSEKGSWNITDIENLTIKKGELRDTIRLSVLRYKALEDLAEDERHTIKLRKVANDEFEIGYDDRTFVELEFDDILTKPRWWESTSTYTWKKLFGDYHRIKYEKWMEIYYYGADPNTYPTSTENLMYWNNMPPNSGTSSQYPVLKAYINLLKKFFEENEYYDDDNNRIRLP